MSTFIKHPRDFWSGAIFIGFGLAAVVIAQDYSMGTAGRMGPAYFPTILGAILAIIGTVSVLRSLFTRGDVISRVTLKGIALVIGATILFGLLIRGAGLPITIVLMVMLSGLASDKFRFVPFLVMAVSLATLCTLVFTIGLGLPMPVIGSWFGV